MPLSLDPIPLYQVSTLANGVWSGILAITFVLGVQPIFVIYNIFLGALIIMWLASLGSFEDVFVLSTFKLIKRMLEQL